MQRYYRQIITTTSDRLMLDKEGLHKMFKIGFKKKTTSWMSHEERYTYLENILDFIAEVRWRRYDTDWRHNENIRYYDLEYAQIDDFLFN